MKWGEAEHEPSSEDEDDSAVSGGRADDDFGKRLVLVFLGLMCVLGAFLRAFRLDSQLWFDEIWLLVDFVRKPLGYCISSYPNDNNHPAYTFLAWLTVHGFGENSASLRLPAAVLGVACIPALYLVGVRLLGRQRALAATVLLALSQHHIWFSQNARGYTGLMLCSLLGVAGFVEARNERRRRGVLLMGASVAAATWFHLTGVYVAMAMAIVIGADYRRSRHRSVAMNWYPLFGLGLATLVSLGLHARMLPDMLHFYLHKESTVVAAREWSNPLWTVLEILRSFGIRPWLGVVFGVIAAPLGVAALIRAWRTAPLLLAMACLPVIFGGGMMLLLGRNLWPRFFFFAAGFFLLIGVDVLWWMVHLCGRRFQWTVQRSGLVFWATVFVVAMVFALRLPSAYEPPKQDFDGAFLYVQQHRGDRPVYAVGLAEYVYRNLHASDFRRLPMDSGSKTSSTKRLEKDAWMIYTLPIHLQGWEPGVLAFIEEHTREVARFRGSVGGGDVVIVEIVE